MAWGHAGRVSETSTTTGTGSLTLAGAKTGYRTFTSQLSTNDYCYYVIQHQTATEWEYGVGQLTASTTLARTLVLGSSNAGSAVSLSSGTKDVFISPAAQMHNALSNLFFGDGSDGDVTVSAGTTTLTRDMYYKNLTVNGSGLIVASGYRIFVSEILDITSAPIGAIRQEGAAGNAGAAGGTAGSATSSTSAATIGGALAGAAGGAGGTAAGSNGSNGNASSPGNGGSGGAGSAGGSGSGGAGGTAGTAGTASNAVSFHRWTVETIRGASLILGGGGGGGGSGGGGDGTAGGGGGSGGGGGGVVWVSARIINRGASTATSAIRAVGGAGGNGGSPAAGNRGGGGGGGGGSGGWIFVAYMHLIGSTKTSCCRVSGNAGGTGGTKTGTGNNGTGGYSGAGGRITLVNLSTNTVSETVGAGSNAPSGTTGGAVVTTDADL